jgi:hypothetical protein
MGIGGCRGLMPQIDDALFLLRSLLRLKGSELEEWISLEPRTSFQPYPQAESAIDSFLAQCRSPAVCLVVTWLIRATNKDELKTSARD